MGDINCSEVQASCYIQRNMWRLLYRQHIFSYVSPSTKSYHFKTPRQPAGHCHEFILTHVLVKLGTISSVYQKWWDAVPLCVQNDIVIVLDIIRQVIQCTKHRYTTPHQSNVYYSDPGHCVIGLALLYNGPVSVQTFPLRNSRTPPLTA